MGKVITVPALSHNILVHEITTPRAFLPGDTLPFLLTGLDTILLNYGQTANYNF
ncbi:hypothetical protein [Rhizosphaericola mali]|uniref:hypothetical protein n=1 Tax=Rhizosphaericola mali TaxID=2545455 RepID=UPI0017871834|nr:hypothetical protein [Rhizosphaericola mali]